MTASVKEVLAAPGAAVETGAILVVIEDQWILRS